MASFQSQLTYVKHLAAVGLEAVASTRRHSNQPVLDVGWPAVVCSAAAIGAGMGAIGIGMSARDTNRSGMAWRGLQAGALGSTLILAWSSRRFVRLAAKNAARSMGVASDQHWLETHPINYG